MSKKWVKPSITIAASVALLSSLYFTTDTLAEKSVEQSNYVIAESDFEVPSSKIEYIKISHENGGYEEHWRDIENKQERHDTYSADGKLINRLIVTDSGKKVISIGNDNGELAAYSWELPSKDAKENNKILKNSLLKQEKDKLKDKKWKIQKSKTLNDTPIDVIETTYDNFKEVVELDQTTGVPVEKDIYEIKNGHEEKIRTETFELLDNSSDLFKVDIKVTEVAADDTKKKN